MTSIKSPVPSGILTPLILFCATLNVSTQPQPTESFQGAKTEIYKTIGGVALPIHIFAPAGHGPEASRPAIVFFFGGGWRNGTPAQFEHHCRYLASRGMVAMTAEYRVASRHQVKAVDCVRDAKSAIRWVRANAARLGVDPKRIAAGGGSAGGHLAAATGILQEFDEETEDRSVSSVPNLLVLFNPAVVLAPVEGIRTLDAERIRSLRDRMGVDPERLSPYHHVRTGNPPALIFHGKADTTVPYITAEMFDRKMREAGNRCELVGYEGQSHGFFNHGRGDNAMFRSTVQKMDRFLASMGYLKGADTVEALMNRTLEKPR